MKGPDKISHAQTDFYKNLYSERLNERDLNYQASLNKFLEFWENTINETELLKSIKNLKTGKTPGSDGLPIFGQI